MRARRGRAGGGGCSRRPRRYRNERRRGNVGYARTTGGNERGRSILWAQGRELELERYAQRYTARRKPETLVGNTQREGRRIYDEHEVSLLAGCPREGRRIRLGRARSLIGTTRSDKERTLHRERSLLAISARFAEDPIALVSSEAYTAHDQQCRVLTLSAGSGFLPGSAAREDNNAIRIGSAGAEWPTVRSGSQREISSAAASTRA